MSFTGRRRRATRLDTSRSLSIRWHARLSEPRHPPGSPSPATPGMATGQADCPADISAARNWSFEWSGYMRAGRFVAAYALLAAVLQPSPADTQPAACAGARAVLKRFLEL